MAGREDGFLRYRFAENPIVHIALLARRRLPKFSRFRIKQLRLMYPDVQPATLVVGRLQRFQIGSPWTTRLRALTYRLYHLRRYGGEEPLFLFQVLLKRLLRCISVLDTPDLPLEHTNVTIDVFQCGYTQVHEAVAVLTESVDPFQDIAL